MFLWLRQRLISFRNSIKQTRILKASSTKFIRTYSTSNHSDNETMTTASNLEIEKFSRMARQWWNFRGLLFLSYRFLFGDCFIICVCFGVANRRDETASFDESNTCRIYSSSFVSTFWYKCKYTTTSHWTSYCWCGLWARSVEWGTVPSFRTFTHTLSLVTHKDRRTHSVSYYSHYSLSSH
jgi:hypothetical protein